MNTINSVGAWKFGKKKSSENLMWESVQIDIVAG